MTTTTQSTPTGSDIPMTTPGVHQKPSVPTPAPTFPKARVQYPMQSVSDLMAHYTQAVRTKVTHEATLAYLSAELASLRAKIKDEKLKCKAANQLESKARQVWERAQLGERHTMLESTLQCLQDAGVRVTKKATRSVTKQLVGRKRPRTVKDETPEQKARRLERNKRQRAYRAKKKGVVPSTSRVTKAGEDPNAKETEQTATSDLIAFEQLAEEARAAIDALSEPSEATVTGHGPGLVVREVDARHLFSDAYVAREIEENVLVQ